MTAVAYKNALISDTMNGHLDDKLTAMLEAVKQRRKVVGTCEAFTLNPGDRVRFIGTINPTYLRGVEAIFIERRRTKIAVRLEKTHGRYYANSSIVVPPELIEKV